MSVRKGTRERGEGHGSVGSLVRVETAPGRSTVERHAGNDLRRPEGEL